MHIKKNDNIEKNIFSKCKYNLLIVHSNFFIQVQYFDYVSNQYVYLMQLYSIDFVDQ